MIPGGYTAEDAAWFGAELARAGMDYLSLSRGGKFEDAKQPRIGWARYPYTGPSGYECMPTVRSDERGPFGRNRAPPARERRGARRRVADAGGPVGRISTFEQAEELLRAGDADIVASARQSLADPDWFRKLRLGLGSEVRRCVFTNYCEGLDQVHKPVTCKLWDHVDLEGEGTPLTADGRRRLVARPGSRATGESRDRRGGPGRPLPRDPDEARRPGPPDHRLRAQPRRRHLRLRRRVLRRHAGERRRGRSRDPRRDPRRRRAGTTSTSTIAARSSARRGTASPAVARQALLDLLAERARSLGVELRWQQEIRSLPTARFPRPI